MELQSFSHSYGQLAYHVVLVTKYRRQVLSKDKHDVVKLIFNEIAIKHAMKLHAIEVLEEHVHIFITIPPTLCLSKAMQLLKGISSRILFKAFPEIKQKLWGGHLWSKGKFFRSVGSVTAEAIQHYIRETQS
ncbi:MAG: IS200/IS605 family transposase [Candidatus Aenigmarchaeota archaeon]|nr:IS200/IS605 family transposase [Candidatus Aenigmarchaeota archaeon]